MEKYGQPDAPTFWFEGIGYRFFPPQELPAVIDLVIVGGGLLGVAIGYWLARLGIDALLLESDRLGAGASGSNAGLLLPAMTALEDPALIEGVLREENIEADYSVPGHLALASSTEAWEAFRREAEQRKDRDGSRGLFALDRSGCEDLLQTPISPGFLGGRWFPGGRLIHPLKLLYGLAHSAVRRGLQISTQTQVTEARPQGAGLVVRTSRGDIATHGVIYACGGAIVNFVPEFRDAVRLTAATVVSTEPVPPVFHMGMAVDWGTIYWRQAPSGEIVSGGDGTGFLERHGIAHTPVPPRPGLTEFLAAAFPNLPKLRVRREWRGVMDSSRDGKPIVGPIPRRSKQWAVTGFNGHGMPLGLSVGRHVADSILTGNRSPALAPFDPSRLECLAGSSQIKDQQSLMAI